jgi:predicted RNase H-like nuclease (RuvC/YqgF family)
MAIDLRKVEPLGSKSVLLEQAIKKNRGKQKFNGASYLEDIDLSDMLNPDYEWLNQDKTALQNLVQQMDKAIAQLAEQMRDMGTQTRHIEQFSRRSKAQLEEEQALLFKQIQTLNTILKRQIAVLEGVERQLEQVEIRQMSILPQLVLGLMAGLASAVTILVAAPWMLKLVGGLVS